MKEPKKCLMDSFIAGAIIGGVCKQLSPLEISLGTLGASLIKPLTDKYIFSTPTETTIKEIPYYFIGFGLGVTAVELIKRYVF